MKRVILYGQLLQQWLAVIVYLWLLQLVAVFGIHDPEPLLDQLADWSAILWTLAFWTVPGVSVAWVVALFVNQRTVLMLNDRAAKAALVLVTAFYFIRWLSVWAILFGNSETVAYALVSISVAMGLWAWRRRRNWHEHEPRGLSLHEWYYVTFLVLVVAALALAIKVNGSIAQLRANQMVVRRAADLRFRHSEPQPLPNVVLIVADSLRSQNMSLFGYRRNTTPFLDRFAEKSNVFSQMYANSTSTRVSMTTILSGKHPFSHGRLTRLLPPYKSSENLVALLRDKGYTTAAITSNLEADFSYLGLTNYLVYGQYANFSRLTLSWLRDNGIYPTIPGNRMYEELSKFLPFLGFPERTSLYGPADDTLNRAARLLFDLPEPFFLFVHVYEPHSPYITPAPFRGRYAKLDYHEVEQKISSNNAVRYPADLQPFVDAHRDHYDEAIEFLDAELARFVQVIGNNPRNRNALLIITSDHGESFERGFFIHGEDLYETSVHVPLIIRYPDQDRGAKSAIPVQSIDLAPTILHAVGAPVPLWMEGRPLTLEASLRERAVIMTNYKEPDNRRVFDWPTKLAIRQRQYKMIVSCDVNRAELYDLRKDPNERTNLSRSKPLIVKNLWMRLQQALIDKKGTARMVCPFSPSA